MEKRSQTSIICVDAIDDVAGPLNMPLAELHAFPYDKVYSHQQRVSVSPNQALIFC